MEKTIYYSRIKGVEWTINYGKTYSFDKDPDLGYTHFNLLPVIEYNHDKFFEYTTNDKRLSIVFKWLFWHFTIARYWGESYE